MSFTKILGKQISDQSVQKSNLDITTVGEAVVTNLIAGTGIVISETGVDVGTGAVTIESSAVDGSVRTFELETLTQDKSANAVLTLPNNKVYVNNGQSLELYLNGSRLYNTIDFTETSTTTITMLRDLFTGDELLWHERHGYEPVVDAAINHASLSNLSADSHTLYHNDSRALTWLSSTQVLRETPTGAVNGVNATFTLANTPVVNTELVYVNGILMDEGGTDDYTIAGSVITFNTAPESGWRVVVSYLQA